MIVFTHRGLEPTNPNFFSEGSFEAFQDHLNRGFGIEFDPNFLADGNIIISHDKSLSQLTLAEVQKIKLENGQIPTFEELAQLIITSNSKINAFHLKGLFQEEKYLDILISHLERFPKLSDKILIFDVKPETARYLKTHLPNVILAPSVAHPYDIQRYNSLVSGTLMTVEDALRYKEEGLYDWVWLDEWGRTDEGGKTKKLYTKEVFDKLKTFGYKIALVTPELHATSPGLLGGEFHQDAKDSQTFFARIKEIISLNPDAICTDYPKEVVNL